MGCLSEWIVTEIKSQNLTADIQIRCPQHQVCKNKYSLDLYVKLVGTVGSIISENSMKAALEPICEAALKHYANNTADIRKCPNSDCTYSGIIPLKHCREELQCPECKRQWRDVIHFSTSEKLIKQFRDALQFNSESFSTLHGLFFEEPCPKCGVLIQKNGGCKHMVCGKCKYEFCWSCLGGYYSYTHSDQRYCPARYSMLVFTIMLLMLLLNQKLFYFSAYFYNFEFYLFKGFLGSAFIDLVVFSMMSYLPLGATLFSCNNYYPPSYLKRVFSLIGVLVALTVHSTFIYFALYREQEYPFLWFSVRCLFWELIFALGSGIIVGVVYLGNKLYKWLCSGNKRRQIARKCE